MLLLNSFSWNYFIQILKEKKLFQLFLLWKCFLVSFCSFHFQVDSKAKNFKFINSFKNKFLIYQFCLHLWLCTFFSLFWQTPDCDSPSFLSPCLLRPVLRRRRVFRRLFLFFTPFLRRLAVELLRFPAEPLFLGRRVGVEFPRLALLGTEAVWFRYYRRLIDLRSFVGGEKCCFACERSFGVCCNGWCSCMDEVIGVDDDRSSGYFSARVVAGRWISHMEWQILLATGMPIVTLSRSIFLISLFLCFDISVGTWRSLWFSFKFLFSFWSWLVYCSELRGILPSNLVL